MLSLQYALTREDYTNYYTYVMWDAPENRKKRTTYYLKQLIPIAFFLLAFYYTGLFDRNSLFILVIAGFLVLTSLLSLFGVRSNIKRQAEKIAENPANSSIFLPLALSASEAGLSIKDELSEGRFQWKAIIRKQENHQYYFLFINGIQAIIIPKRAFHSSDEKQLFDKLLQQQLSFDAEIGHLLRS